jgi:hypothetical protein
MDIPTENYGRKGVKNPVNGSLLKLYHDWQQCEPLIILDQNWKEIYNTW